MQTYQYLPASRYPWYHQVAQGLDYSHHDNAIIKDYE